MINGMQTLPVLATRTRLAARWICLPAIIGLWIGSPAHAVTPRVKDAAGFFSAAAVEKANRQIADIEQRFHRDLLIETFATVPADKVAEVKNMDKPGREAFFKKWGNERFRQEGVNGVYILIAKSPGFVQIEVGADTQKRIFTTKDAAALRDIVFGGFKKREYDRALEDGVAYVERTMGTNTAARSRPGVGPIAGPLGRVGVNHNAPIGHNAPIANNPIGGKGMSIGGWLILIVVVLVGLWIFMAILRGIGRALSGGGRPMPGPGYGGGGYGPGYGGGYGGGGGGGFMSGMLGGLFGAAAGNWLYDSFRGSGGSSWGGGGGGMFGAGSTPEGSDLGQDASGVGGEFDSGGDGGGDAGGDAGGDFGGGDFGDAGGGDFGGGGGGDFGGGDFA
jgi:hypothetical protein